MEQTKFTRFKRITNKKLLSALAVLMLLSGSLYFLTCNSAPVNRKSIKITHVSNNPKNITKIDTVQFIDSLQIKDSIQDKLIEEVNKYIKRYAPKSHQFIPKYLVQAGLDNNIDICFMMAQTQIETCYGTTGAGRESSRRSMFGIIKKRYPNYEVAVNHYCEVLKKHYLVKGKTEQQLMVKYTTAKGGRYGGHSGYEAKLRGAYNQIKRTTNIYNLQKEYEKF